MSQTYEIRASYQDEVQQHSEVYLSVLLNATEGYGYTVERVLSTATGRVRVTLSEPFPQAELDSFAGEIIPVGAEG